MDTAPQKTIKNKMSNIYEIVFPKTQPNIGKVTFHKNNKSTFVTTESVENINKYLIANNLTYQTDYLFDRTIFYGFK